MKKVILMAVVATFLMSSCNKEANYQPCEGKYQGYEVETKKGKCYYAKGVSTSSYKQIDKKYCKCLD